MPHQALLELEKEGKKKLALGSFVMIGVGCLVASLILTLFSGKIQSNLLFAFVCGIVLLSAAWWCRERSHVVTGAQKQQ